MAIDIYNSKEIDIKARGIAEEAKPTYQQ